MGFSSRYETFGILSPMGYGSMGEKNVFQK
jgi:hypothetical protein